MILFEGPSLINGRPIVVIATPDSNPKTGEMLYTWILDAEISPEEAAFNGVDESICGGCKFRAQPSSVPSASSLSKITWKHSRICYVRLSSESDEFGTPKADEKMGPAEIWRAWKNGEFGRWQSFGPVPAWQNDECRMSWYQYHGPLSVRIGSYGDPGAAPTEMWIDLVRYAPNFTAYTHLWKTCDQQLKKYCMASVDTPEERIEANEMGWRAFVVAPMDVDVAQLGSDVLCPMTAGKPVTCNTCHMCQGTSSKVKQNIWEKAHGVNLANHVW